MKRKDFIRLIIISTLVIIIIQIYRLPPQDPYMDLVLLQPDDGSWTYAVSANNELNTTSIYPYIRNVMDQTLLIKISVYGIFNITSLTFYDNNSTLLNTDHSGIYASEIETRAINDEFDSLWVIEEWTVYNLTSSMTDVAMVVFHYDQSNWIFYDWVSIRII